MATGTAGGGGGNFFTRLFNSDQEKETDDILEGKEEYTADPKKMSDLDLLRAIRGAVDPEEKKKLRQEQFLRRQAKNREKVGTATKTISDAIKGGVESHKETKKDTNEQVAKLLGLKTKAPATPSILLDTPEKKAAVASTAKEELVEETTSTPKSFSGEELKEADEILIPNASAYYKKKSEELNTRTTELQDALESNIKRRDLIEAIGNALISAMNFYRASQNPTGAALPVTKMPRIDFNSMNDRDLKLYGHKVANLRDNLRGDMQAKGMDIATKKHEQLLAARKESPKVDTEKRKSIAQLVRDKNAALSNLGRDKKSKKEFSDKLRVLGATEAEIAEVDYGWTDMTDDDELAARRALIDTVVARRLNALQLGTAEDTTVEESEATPTQPSNRTKRKAPDGKWYWFDTKTKQNLGPVND